MYEAERSPELPQKETKKAGVGSRGLSSATSRLIDQLKLDHVTYVHSLNVARHTTELIKRLRPDIPVETAYYSGLFHDIGKISIDSGILNKPDSLSEEELSIMKAHSERGYDILSRYELPDEILVSAKYHHEKFNGSGYPYGLTGDEIPSIVRVVSMCDIYDALTSDRPYRKAYNKKEALNIMREMHLDFDQNYLEEFINYMNERDTAP